VTKEGESDDQPGASEVVHQSLPVPEILRLLVLDGVKVVNFILHGVLEFLFVIKDKVFINELLVFSRNYLFPRSKLC